jgi:SAM-dependent methyltransferase
MPAPYDVLAAGYDAVMDHVDYDYWAAHVHRLLRRHGTGTERVLELGGGTGSLALRLQARGDYDYVCTDGSAAMVREARAKIDAADAPIACAQVDFAEVTLDDLGQKAPFDAAVLVYDGLNYLTDEGQVASLFRAVHDALRPGGIFVVDQSTPANSEDADAFVDEGTTDDFAYVRESHYDPDTRRHVTTFEITTEGRTVRERHVQRAYTPEEVRDRLAVSPLTIVAAYDGFTLDAAHPQSHRVHWVAQRPPA